MPESIMPHAPARPAPGAVPDLAAIRAGNADALAACYRAYAPALLALAYKLTASRADAEDVVHDVFVGLPEALARYDERGQFSGWLARIATRVALARQRHGSRFEADDAALETVAVPADTGDVVVADRVHRALASLSPALRHVFVLRVVLDLSHAEIAALLGITPNASEVRLHRAVQQLRGLLGSLA
jgi:RNA polymerase sigma-70 factor (ECF subfamily)